MLLQKVTVVVLLLQTSATAVQQASRPHIIFILADDLGYHDAPWHNPLVKAPALRSLADDGVTLEQAYMLPVCSPSRAALLSGRYPHTSGMMYKAIKPLQPTGLPLGLTLLPQRLKKLGYSTHAVGKWHLGFCKDEYTPLRRGFDSFKGFYTGSLDYYDHSQSTKRVTPKGNKSRHRKSTGLDFRNNATTDSSAVGKYSTFEFVKTIQSTLLARNASDPLFLYAALQNPHGPLQVPRRFLRLYPSEPIPKRRMLLGMISALDAAVNAIVRTLKETGHYNDSIIVFSSDNGGSWQKMGMNWPLRGAKSSLFEGGTRVPTFITSPRLAQRGVAYTGVFHGTDWYPTLLEAIGGAVPEGLDGVSQWEALNGRAAAPRRQMVYHMLNKRGLSVAMRFDNHKIMVGNFRDKGWGVPPEYQALTDEFLETFLDSGRAMDIVPPKARISTAQTYGVARKLFFWNATDVQDFEGYDYPESSEREDFMFDSPENIHESYHLEFSTLKTEGNLDSRSLSETVLPSNRELRGIRKRKKQRWGQGSAAYKLQRKQEKLLHRLRKRHHNRVAKQEKKSRKKAFKLSKPRKLNPNPNQKVVRNKSISINDIRSANDLLRSGIPLHLYNLADDPYERHNIAGDEPQVLRAMLRRLVPELRKYVQPHDPPMDPAGDPVNFGGAWSPGWC